MIVAKMSIEHEFDLELLNLLPQGHSEPTPTMKDGW
jgi:hypothetical protein